MTVGGIRARIGQPSIAILGRRVEWLSRGHQPRDTPGQMAQCHGGGLRISHPHGSGRRVARVRGPEPSRRVGTVPTCRGRRSHLAPSATGPRSPSAPASYTPNPQETSTPSLYLQLPDFDVAPGPPQYGKRGPVAPRRPVVAKPRIPRPVPSLDAHRQAPAATRRTWRRRRHS